MAKIKLTKGELKRQRDSLAQFRHYLPTLQLKKQQLQMKIWEIRRHLMEKQAALTREKERIGHWVSVLSEPGVDLRPWVVPAHVNTDQVNIAGATVPVLIGVDFAAAEYDFYATPLWVDRAIVAIRSIVSLRVEIRIIEQQIAILQQELRVTTQRVNLFEKVKVPECLDNIRRIRICLGDQQANAVGISKVAKKKIDMRLMEEMAA